jgi:hypothetical protein
MVWDIKYHAAMEIVSRLLSNNYSAPLSITQEQLDGFAQYINFHEENGSTPDLQEILDYAKFSLGFEFTTVQVPFEDR